MRAPALLNRNPKDFDFIATGDEAISWLHKYDRHIDQVTIGKLISTGDPPVEFDLIIPGSSNELLADIVDQENRGCTDNFGRIPSLDILFTIKSSHKYKKNNPHFWKTLHDYHRMKAAGAKIHPELHKLREKESYAAQTHPKLNVNKTEFFKDDGVKYIYDHDDIHNAVKHLDKPAYQYYMKDGSEVFSDKSKFFAQPRETQLFGVLEECATLAIERSLVPFPGAMTPLKAIQYAYSKVCTSITSGWFRAFAYDEAPTILPLLDDKYWRRFQVALNSKQVRYSNV